MRPKLTKPFGSQALPGYAGAAYSTPPNSLAASGRGRDKKTGLERGGDWKEDRRRNRKRKGKGQGRGGSGGEGRRRKEVTGGVGKGKEGSGPLIFQNVVAPLID